jgi:hypothetical protein
MDKQSAGLTHRGAASGCRYEWDSVRLGGMGSNRLERLDRDPYDRLLGANVLLREEPEEDDDEEEEDNGKGEENDVEDDDEDEGYSVFPVSMRFSKSETWHDA